MSLRAFSLWRSGQADDARPAANGTMHVPAAHPHAIAPAVSVLRLAMGL